MLIVMPMTQYLECSVVLDKRIKYNIISPIKSVVCSIDTSKVKDTSSS